MRKHYFSRGFTLVELLVVIAISAMLAGMSILYSSAAREQIALSVESAKVSGAVLRAKDLALATFTPTTENGKRVCGYGILFDSSMNGYSIFAFTPDPTVAAYKDQLDHNFCPSSEEVASYGEIDAKVGDPGVEVEPVAQSSWETPVLNSITMDENSSLKLVLFVPPDPQVFISSDALGIGMKLSTISPPLGVTLDSPDGKSSSTVWVNIAGQVYQ